MGPRTRPPRTPQPSHLSLLRSLTEVVGVSGDERLVRRLVRGQIEPWVDELRVDALGNLLAIRTGKARRKVRVLLAAHMDEVGVMITGADQDGSLHFQKVGGLPVAALPGKVLWVGEKRQPAVIGLAPPHLSRGKDAALPLEEEDLRLDVGAADREEALKRVRIGDRAAFATPMARAGEVLFAKALDDRVGVAILIELLQHPPENIDLMAAFTVQEELDHQGATVAAESLDPQLAVAVDSTPARDLPTWDGSENRSYNTRLGEGPALYPVDSRTIADPRLLEWLAATARAERIPHQLRQPGDGSTDAGAIHRARTGIPSISVSVPGRYPHTAVGLIRIDDWRNTVALLHAALCRVTPDLLSPPGRPRAPARSARARRTKR